MRGKKSLLERWRQHTLGNQALVITGALVALSSLVYTGATIFQIIMLKQNAEQTTYQVDRLIAASERTANTANTAVEDARRVNVEMLNRLERVLRSNEEIANATSKQANTSQVLARAAESQAKTSGVTAMAAKESAVIAQQSMVASSRPYLTISIIQAEPLEANQPVKVFLEIVNDGNSPANNFTVQAQFVFSPYLKPPTNLKPITTLRMDNESEFSLMNLLYPTTIAPHKGTINITAKSGANLSIEDLKAIEEGGSVEEVNARRDKQLVLYGEGSYEGVGGSYTLKLCRRYDYNPLTKEGNWSDCFHLTTEK